MIFRGPFTAHGRGAPIYALPYAALMGDSLTDYAYGLTSWFGLNGGNGGRVELLANCGVSGNSIQNMLSRVNNDYTASPPGLAGIAGAFGISKLGYVVIRAGTNNVRGGGAMPTSEMTSLLNACAAYADRVIILSIPPVENVSGNAESIIGNTWLENFAAANPSVFRFVNDSDGMRLTGGEQDAQFFADDVHPNHLGVGVLVAGGYPNVSDWLGAYASPLSTDPADIYPAQPQWVVNPTMSGTSGTKPAGYTGTVATGLTILGLTGTASIIAADGDDVNQTPWQRIVVASSSGSSPLSVKVANQGRTMSSTDPAALEVMFEVRFTEVDTTKINSVSTYVQADTTESISPGAVINLEPFTTVSETFVMRVKRPRTGSSSPTALNFYINFGGAAFTGGAGSVDLRCITIRG